MSHFFLWYPLSILDIVAVSLQYNSSNAKKQCNENETNKSGALPAGRKAIALKAPCNDVFLFLNVWWRFAYDGS